MSEKYCHINIGTVDGFKEIGREMFGKQLGLTGCEVSLNSLAKGKFTPFVHAHKRNEELYFVIRGKGKLMVDHEEFAIQEGSFIRVGAEAGRAISADADSELVFLCVQAEENSLKQATEDDGIITEQKASWMK